MENSILNKMANYDFLLKVLERFYDKTFIKISIFWKTLNFDKNRDTRKLFHLFVVIFYAESTTGCINLNINLFQIFNLSKEWLEGRIDFRGRKSSQ